MVTETTPLLNSSSQTEPSLSTISPTAQPLLSRAKTEPSISTSPPISSNGIRPSPTIDAYGDNSDETSTPSMPFLKRLFGGGANLRSCELLRKRNMRRANSSSSSFDTNANTSSKEGLQGVLKELEENESVSTRYILFGMFCIFNHFAGGVISMMVLEGWNIYDASYFCVVTLTTVGYGDLSPSTSLSKLFVIYYVIVSIAIVSSYLAYFVGLLIDKQEELLLRRMIAPESSTTSLLSNDIVDGTDYLESNDYVGLMYSITLLIFVIIFGTLIFATLEGFNWLDAMYATVISATTVGFGDLHPQHSNTKLFMTVWLIFSTIAVAKVVADFTEARVKAKQRALTRRILTATLDRDILQELDDNRDGRVEWGEFLSAMLVSCGKISKDELDTFRCRFNQLDTDGDCVIDVHTGC